MTVDLFDPSLDLTLAPAPATPTLASWTSPRVPSWPVSVKADQIEPWDLFTREWPHERYFGAFEPTDARPTSAALREQTIAPRVVLLVVDLEAPDDADRAEWNQIARERATRLVGEPFGFLTKRGARLVWRLPQAIEVQSLDAARRFGSWYRRTLIAIAATTGLVGDLACADPLRLHRAPHTRREGERSSDALGWLCGHPVDVGELRPFEVSHDKCRAALDTLCEKYPQWRRAFTRRVA
ncbi:MAG: hypothetical protein ACHREM_13785 [Polyangiales bacterium]